MQDLSTQLCVRGGGISGLPLQDYNRAVCKAGGGTVCKAEEKEEKEEAKERARERAVIGNTHGLSASPQGVEQVSVYFRYRNWSLATRPKEA